MKALIIGLLMCLLIGGSTTVTYASDKAVLDKSEQAALVLIEYQREWIDEDGKIHKLLEDKAQFKEALDNSDRLVKAARKSGVPIIHVGLAYQDGHPELGKSTYGLRGAIANFSTFPANGKGSQFVKPFIPQKGEFLVSGRTGASAFAGSNLDSYLRNNRINKLYIAGFALHVCVESTLRHGHDLGYDITVIQDATAAFNQAQRKHVLEDVVHHFDKTATVNDFIAAYNQ